MSRRDRRYFLLAACALAAAPGAHAQQPDKVWRVGFLALRSRSTPSRPDAHYDAFVAGMRDLGYVEGKNLAIEWRFAEEQYERLSGLANEPVRKKVDVIVSQGTPGTRAAQRATSTIPIVCGVHFQVRRLASRRVARQAASSAAI